MVAEKLNDELALLLAHLVTPLQPKPAGHLLCISISYATSNDAYSLLKQQNLYYKTRSRGFFVISIRTTWSKPMKMLL